MAWSPTLVAKLDDPAFTPLFRVVGSNVIAADGSTAEAFTFENQRIVIEQSSADAAGRLQSAGGRVSVSRGSWSVAIGMDPSEFAEVIGQNARRGSKMRLEIGWPGLDALDYEVVQRGVLRNVRQRGSVYVFECDSIIGYLQSRTLPIGANDGTESLFHDLGGATTIYLAYVVGDTTVYALTADFLANAAGLYAFKLVADSGTEFYLTATGKTFNTFTGVSTTGQFGTTAGAAAIGQAITGVYHDEANPTVVARRLLTSRNGAGNGAYDYYPTSWSFGLHTEFIDEEDTEWWRDHTFPAAGSGVYTLVVNAPQPEALAWLEAWLNPAGYFLCERMGNITIRALHPVSGDGGVGGETWESPGTTDIGLDDIVSVDDYERWDSTQPVEYGSLSITDGLGSISTRFPAGAPITNPSAHNSDAGAVDGIRANSTDLKSEILERLEPFASRINEVLSLTCRGWRLATLAIGDVVRVTAPVGHRAATVGAPTLDGQRAIVASVRPNWFGTDEAACTRVVLLIQPGYDDANS